MSYLPQRRKEDRKTGRAFGFVQRFFFIIGVSATISVVLLAITLSRMMNYVPPSLPDKILLTYVFDADLQEVVTKPTMSQPLLRPGAIISEVVTALRAAATDDRVKGFVAKIEDVNFTLAQIQEMRDALAVFNKSGKFSYVYSDSFGGMSSGMGDYYLATAFSNVWMQPVGSLAINGISSEMPFLKGVFEKVGVTADFAHKGLYKSAPEMFTERAMTAPHREMMTSLIGDLSGQIITGIATARKIPEESLRKIVDGAPYNEFEALDLKLIDHIGYFDQMLDEGKSKVDGVDTEAVDLLRYAFVTETRKINKGVSGFVAKFYRKDAPASVNKDKAKIALIFASGEIIPYKGGGQGFGEGGISATKVSAAFRAAQKDDDVVAVVLRLDSPGGAPSAAETIRRALLQTREKGKPVVVSMSSAAASGGYWIASAADKIVAQPATLTGSIGVFGGKFVFGDLYQKLGVSWDSVNIGDHAGMWSARRPFTASERQRIDAMMQDIYDAFITRVMDGRKMTREQATAVAEGRVFTGRQALENGLVDQLGGLEDAIKIARDAAKIAPEEDVPVVHFPPRKSTLELFISLASEGAFFAPSFDIKLADIEKLVRADERILMMQDVTVK